MTPPEDAHKEETVKAICVLYEQAPRLAQEGEPTVSTDEMTGVQALERKHAGLSLAPGKVERREFEYIRHGTRSFILSRDVVTGTILAPCCGLTRTEADFLAHLQALVATDPEAIRWHIVCDCLNTHQSESLVRWVAHRSGMNQIEIWLSILVRKLLKRGSFISIEDLQAKVLAFIDYYNQTMAQPFKWTYQGKALMA